MDPQPGGLTARQRLLQHRVSAPLDAVEKLGTQPISANRKKIVASVVGGSDSEVGCLRGDRLKRLYHLLSCQLWVVATYRHHHPGAVHSRTSGSYSRCVHVTVGESVKEPITQAIADLGKMIKQIKSRLRFQAAV